MFLVFPWCQRYSYLFIISIAAHSYVIGNYSIIFRYVLLYSILLYDIKDPTQQYMEVSKNRDTPKSSSFRWYFPFIKHLGLPHGHGNP